MPHHNDRRGPIPKQGPPPASPLAPRTPLERMPAPVQRPESPPPPPTPPRWEYRAVDSDCDGAALNALGAEGWEAVAVVSSFVDRMRVLMKRRVADTVSPDPSAPSGREAAFDKDSRR